MKKNMIFAACILLAAAILALLLYPNRKSGALAYVSIADGESFTLSLEENGVFSYGTETGAGLPFTLEVQDGAVRFIESQCPDHVCEGFGWLSHAHDEAICLPAGVVVSVEAQE